MTKLLSTVALLAALALPGVTAAQPASPALAAKAWLLIETDSGQVLAEHEADARFEPASLTKLMTAYLAFEALRDKRITLEQRPAVSMAAYKAVGSRMFVDPVKPATVEELLRGMIIQSGNDASIILAEAIAGSEPAFAEMMNREAKRMGLESTQFRNATGLPDPEHYSSARDLAVVATRVIQDFPDHYRLYSQKEYTYNNIRQPNRNRLLSIDPSVDGMKTGFTQAAGYCLISSARRAQAGGGFERRLLSVVLGTSSDAARAMESQKLLNFGFQNFDAVRVHAHDQSIGTYRVWKGKENEVAGGFTKDVVVTVPRGQAQRISGEVERIEPLVAPITKGQRIGILRVRLDDQVIAERPLIALKDVDEGGWFGRLWDGLRLMISR
ncbi:MAG: D-alanyl-D-alanine carboxypeptidase [Burkholderiaceae bacterium]|nr:D-alanyl-D-alanine carboxypeptidase [Burkholderiaceae bacterium]